MDYTKLVTKRGQYKYSVNICFDLRDEERIAGFHSERNHNGDFQRISRGDD